MVTPEVLVVKKIFFSYITVAFFAIVDRVSFADPLDDGHVVALFSQTGNGKSRTGNIMLNQDIFKVGHGSTPVSIPESNL